MVEHLMMIFQFFIPLMVLYHITQNHQIPLHYQIHRTIDLQIQPYQNQNLTFQFQRRQLKIPNPHLLNLVSKGIHHLILLIMCAMLQMVQENQSLQVLITISPLIIPFHIYLLHIKFFLLLSQTEQSQNPLKKQVSMIVGK